MASQQRPKIKVVERSEFGSRVAKRKRREGLVLGVVYGGGNEARAFEVSDRELRTVLQTGAALFDLEFDGSSTPVVIKEQQRHPVRGNLEHLDLLEVKLDVAIESEVPIEVEGAEEAPGTKEGGVLEHVTREITVEALPTDIPEKIVVDVSAMEINDTIQLSAVTPPQGVTFMAEDPEEVTIATLSPPRIEEEPEPELEEEAVLVGEDGEPIEPPEGEEGEEPAAEGEEQQQPERIGEEGGEE
jgi:large subunit ribosomal protein L25